MAESSIETQSAPRKQMTGFVVGNGMNKTIVVLTERTLQHPLYKKYIRRRRKYYAHDPENTCQVGDKVRITECRPLSKNKRWQLTEILERAK